MTIQRLKELQSKYREQPRETCLFCGRNCIVTTYDNEYVVQCPKWGSFLGYLKGDAFYHYFLPTGVIVFDDNKGWTK